MVLGQGFRATLHRGSESALGVCSEVALKDRTGAFQGIGGGARDWKWNQMLR